MPFFAHRWSGFGFFFAAPVGPPFGAAAAGGAEGLEGELGELGLEGELGELGLEGDDTSDSDELSSDEDSEGSAAAA